MSTFIRRAIAIASTVCLASLAACSGNKGDDAGATASSANADGATTLTIGASPVPHGDILQFVQDNLAKDAGLDLKIVEYTDYVQPNVALSEGELDANFFQHVPYFEAEVAEKGYQFDHFDGVHIEPYGVYSEKIKDIAELGDGAKVGISNDPSNQARALQLLVKEGVLKDANKEDASILDYQGNTEANPKNIEFVESEAAALPRLLPDVDAAIINGNFALEAGLKPAEDAIVLESGENNPYANVVAYRTDTDKKEALQKLDELLHSSQVAEFIKQKWPNGEVIPAFK